MNLGVLSGGELATVCETRLQSCYGSRTTLLKMFLTAETFQRGVACWLQTRGVFKVEVCTRIFLGGARLRASQPHANIEEAARKKPRSLQVSETF